MPDGTTQRDHIESYQQQTGVIPEGWEPVECPACMRYLWGYFLEMNCRRTSTGFGINPISHEALDAWQRLRGIKLLPFEIRALDALESAFLLSRNKAKK